MHSPHVYYKNNFIIYIIIYIIKILINIFSLHSQLRKNELTSDIHLQAWDNGYPIDNLQYIFWNIDVSYRFLLLNSLFVLQFLWLDFNISAQFYSTSSSEKVSISKDTPPKKSAEIWAKNRKSFAKFVATKSHQRQP